MPALVGLRSYGVNEEGKTRPGVPDSYIGDTPRTCRAAVEYTTQGTDLDKKLEGDYDKVRARCPSATLIVLCTNRSLEDVNVAAIEAKASADRISLEILDGRRLAQHMNERHDLRFEHLGIPIGAHTVPSLVARGRRALEISIAHNLQPHALERFLPRVRASQQLAERFRRSPAVTLVIAPAGMGKSIWSAAEASRYAHVRFVAWASAKRLPLKDPDPIGIHMAHIAYGVSDRARLHELADLLQRERAQACVFLDAIDETHDFGEIERAVQVFRTSAIATFTHLVLICRAGAVAELESALGCIVPEILDRNDGRIGLDELSTEEAALLLAKHDATNTEERELRMWLPREFRGVPLFLLSALRAYRGAHLPLTASNDIISVFAEHFVREIADRMKRDGTGPSVVTVRNFLQRIAIIAFDNVHHVIPAKALVAVPGGEERGENSLISRAVQSGLLLAFEEELGFSHPLFLEYFAGTGLENVAAPWMDRLASFRTVSGRRITTRLAKVLPDPEPFIHALLSVDGISACEAANHVAKTLSSELVASLLAIPQHLLRSRFPSDRRRGLRLLAGLRSQEAIDCTVNWWNNATKDERIRFSGEAADTFLSLQIQSASSLVLNHYQLQQPSGMPWYEPSFVRRLESLRHDFAGSVRDAAFQAVSKGPRSSAALMLLAILRDHRLVAWLAEQVSKRALNAEEHRALIHINTAQSIGVFVESIDRHFAALRTLEGRDDQQSTHQRDEYSDMLTTLMSDIAMYPHDQLVEVIGAALESSVRDHVWFGMAWADALPDPAYISAYAAARLRYSDYVFAISGRMFDHLLKRLSLSRIIEIFRLVNRETQRQIVHHMYQVSDPGAEAFLIGLLDDPLLRFDAIQCLGMIGAYGAAPAVARHLDDPDGNTRYMCVKTLGRLRYTPVLDRFINDLSALLLRRASDEADTHDLNLEYELTDIIAKIGDDKALAWLVDHMKDLAHPERGVKGLLRFGEKGIEHLRHLVSTGVVEAATLVQALVSGRLRKMNAWHARPWIADELLFERVLSVARKYAANTSRRLSDCPYFAVAEFDLSEAKHFLEEMAHTTNAPTGTAHEEARTLLVSMGVEPYASEALETAIDLLEKKPYVWKGDLLGFRNWSHDRVRIALLRRLSDHNGNAVLLSAFRSFATSIDRNVFERYEADPRIAVADIAHEYLEGLQS